MTTSRVLYRLAPLALLFSCTPESDQVTFGISAMSFANSEWSAPVNLGPTINTAAAELQPALSSDELSLYFASNRAGGFGLNDIWVSRRGCRDCPWETPVNLGSAINSASIDDAATMSIDGHLLFFASDRPGGMGLRDIYVSRREGSKDDFAWGPPIPLGGDVNTAASEIAPEYLQSAEDGAVNFYFVRQPAGGLFAI